MITFDVWDKKTTFCKKNSFNYKSFGEFLRIFVKMKVAIEYQEFT